MSLEEELRELVLSDKLPEILRMLAKTFHDRAEEHEKKMKEFKSFEDDFNSFGEASPGSPYGKEVQQYVWWAHRGFELERLAESFEREIQDRDLTASERDEKREAEEIKRKKEELARFKARCKARRQAAEPGGH